MFVEFTEAGRWYVRNEKGQIVSKHYDSYDDLINELF